MKATFTINQLVETVQTLAAERPDFVYEQIPLGACYYTKSACSTTDGCLFGQAILRLQPELRPTLEEWDTNREKNHASGIMTLLQSLGIDYTTEVGNLMLWCCQVQGMQDRKTAWGKAVKLLLA